MSNNELTLVVLAAGMGSRYGGLKQMDPMGMSGEWLLQYALYDARKAGFSKVVFIIRRDFEEAFLKEIEGRCPQGLEIGIAYQELDDLPRGATLSCDREKPLGTGHAIWCARSQVNGPFAVINADDFYGREALETMCGALSELKSSARDTFCMVAYRLENTLSENGHVSRGICRLSDEGKLERVTEHTKIVKTEKGPMDMVGEVALCNDDLVSMNLWGFTDEVFDYLEVAVFDFIEKFGHQPKSELYIPFVIDELIQKNTVSVNVLQTDSSWFGVTYPEDKPLVREGIRGLIRSEVYPDPLNME